MSTWGAPVVRPDGRTYIPRKPCRVVEVENAEPYGEEPYAWVYVLGTHDIEQAYTLARKQFNVRMETGRQAWCKITVRQRQWFWGHDPIAGAATVIFEVEE